MQEPPATALYWLAVHAVRIGVQQARIIPSLGPVNAFSLIRTWTPERTGAREGGARAGRGVAGVARAGGCVRAAGTVGRARAADGRLRRAVGSRQAGCALWRIPGFGPRQNTVVSTVLGTLWTWSQGAYKCSWRRTGCRSQPSTLHKIGTPQGGTRVSVRNAGQLAECASHTTTNGPVHTSESPVPARA